MTASKKSSYAFGSSQKRFGKITFHPNLDPSGLYANRSEGCDPCLYHPKSLRNTCENKNRKAEPWRCKTELESWSRNLGYRNQKLLDQRRWQASLLGPGWTEVIESPKYTPACLNVNFSRTPRFKPSKNEFPGPGNYYRAVPFKAPHGPHSSRPTLEREAPCRFKSTAVGLAPNRYTIVDKECIEQTLKKVISRRGPYDLFTGKRDGSSIKNHFNQSMKCMPPSWPMAFPGTLTKYDKSHFGKLNKTNRSTPYRGRLVLVDQVMCIKRPNEPGAAHYNVDKPKEFTQYKYGFNSSYDKPPGYQRMIPWPGVGRYKPHSISCGLIGHGWRHVFQSKVRRTIGANIPEPMNSF